MHLTLVLPGLLDQPPAMLAAVGALSHLASSARVMPHDDIDTALLAALEIDAAPAPLAALGAGLASLPAWTIRADPVTMHARRDDVRVVGRVDDLSDAEAATLRGLLTAHFASDELAFHAPRTDTWFVGSERAFALETTPLSAAVGRALAQRLPRGKDGGVWRRWFTEIQMLLHEHALAERTTTAVNAVWFSGGGALPSRADLRKVAVFASGGRDADVARGIAMLAGKATVEFRPVADAIASDRAMDAVVIVQERVTDNDNLRSLQPTIEAAWQALHDRAVQTLTLVADDRGGRAASWRATRPGWLDRLRRRNIRFAMPATEDRE